MDLSSLLSNLSESDLTRLRETAASVFGSDPSSFSPPAASPPAASHAAPAPPSSMPDSPPPAPPIPSPLTSVPGTQLFSAAANLARMFSARDPRSDLLFALKPFLGETRRKRADQAAMMLKLLTIVDRVREDKNA